MSTPELADQYYEGFREEFETRREEVARKHDIESLLIMRSTPTHMVTAVSAGPRRDTSHPGDAGAKSVVPGNHKLYCEEVVNTRRPLHVSDAGSDPEWKGNEDLVRFGLGTYLGFPITGPDGSIVGTVCALHDKPYDFDAGLRDELTQVQAEIEERLRDRK
jgi:GAF domain-containing protein